MLNFHPGLWTWLTILTARHRRKVSTDSQNPGEQLLSNQLWHLILANTPHNNRKCISTITQTPETLITSEQNETRSRRALNLNTHHRWATSLSYSVLSLATGNAKRPLHNYRNTLLAHKWFEIRNGRALNTNKKRWLNYLLMMQLFFSSSSIEQKHYSIIFTKRSKT